MSKSAAKIKVGLLLCDDVDREYQSRYGDYAAMFGDGLRAVDDDFLLTPIRCHEGELPDSVDDFDGYLISGSRAGVYDELQWIAALQDFVRRCFEARKKTVGICFGHQLIAQALGGEAKKSDAGWGIGVQNARIISPQTWMNGDDDSRYNLIVVHQDQVIKLPRGFRVIAENDFCPVSMFVGDDVALGIQGHPEFSREFCTFRVHARREILGEDVFHNAIDSLTKTTPDSSRVLSWVARFLRGE